VKPEFGEAQGEAEPIEPSIVAPLSGALPLPFDKEIV
jgi:hypothetical protein